MKLNWKFQRDTGEGGCRVGSGGGGGAKNLMEEVWVFSGAAQFFFRAPQKIKTFFFQTWV